MATNTDAFGATATLTADAGTVIYYRLAALADAAKLDLDRLPVTVKILLENVLRLSTTGQSRPDDVRRLAQWSPEGPLKGEFPFLPARVLLQDFTGVPAV